MNSIVCLWRVAAMCIIASIYGAQTEAMSVNVRHRECFYEELGQGVKCTGSFQVLTGQTSISLPGDFVFTITDSSGTLVYDSMDKNQRKEEEGKFKFTSSKDGLHAFCFNNRNSQSDKVVGFTILVHEGKDEPESVARRGKLSPLEEKIIALSDGLETMQEQQRYLRARESVHSLTTQSTNSRVLWWSFIEAFVLVSMSLWQVYYLRNFFEVKRLI